MDRAGCQMAPLLFRGFLLPGPPYLIPLLFPHLRPQPFRHTPQGRTPLLPQVYPFTVYLPRVPCPSGQIGRFLLVRTLTRVAPMPLHSHLPSPVQEPRMASIRPILVRIGALAVRTTLPIPRPPLSQAPKPLDKLLASLYNIHRLCCLPLISPWDDSKASSILANLNSPTNSGTESSPAPSRQNRNLVLYCACPINRCAG